MAEVNFCYILLFVLLPCNELDEGTYRALKSGLSCSAYSGMVVEEDGKLDRSEASFLISGRFYLIKLSMYLNISYVNHELTIFSYQFARTFATK